MKPEETDHKSPEERERLRSRLSELACDGRISCPVVRSIAEEEGVSYDEVGRLANELKIKISGCELGCF